MKERTYLAIDLKSYYASVECVERGLNPMTTHLVVADAQRTEKTICLAVSPALKAHGISGRPRLFEVMQKVKEINAKRREAAPHHMLDGASCDENELKSNPQLALDFMVAAPRMAYYMKQSAGIYEIYTKYVAPADIHVYSIDEVFMDITGYLPFNGLSAREFAKKIILDVLETTGITATVGIGPNLYLAKVAMDIEAKHIPPDAFGVRIAQLDPIRYRKKLWSHQPITDFWRIGRGYAKKLAEYGMYTMGDVARCSLGKEHALHNQELLYHLFGVNAELLIDHAWGLEPCTIADIKAYRPASNSISSGQVLPYPYAYEQAKLVVQEMADSLSLDLVEKGCVTDQLVLTIGYDRENVQENADSDAVQKDYYGRTVPKHSHGTISLEGYTASTQKIMEKTSQLYENIVQKRWTVRRLNLTANHVIGEGEIPKTTWEQLDLFHLSPEDTAAKEAEQEALQKEKKLQKALVGIKQKYGKNAVLKGMNLEEGATAKERNHQIGGHRA